MGADSAGAPEYTAAGDRYGGLSRILLGSTAIMKDSKGTEFLRGGFTDQCTR